MKDRIRKLLTGMLLVVLCVGILCACTSRESDRSDSTADLPQLKIGVDTLEPFYSIDGNGNPVGIDAEIALEACRRAGYEPVFVPIIWDEKDTALADGTVDCLWNAFSEDGREDQYSWTVSYMESNLRVIVEAGTRDRTPKDLNHSLGIAVRAGSKVEEIFLNSTEPALPIYSCGSFDIAKTAFVKGYTSALACHEAVLQQMLNENPGLYRFLDGNLMTVHLGVAFSRNAPSAAYGSLDAALREMKEDGSLDEIVNRHSGPMQNPQEAPHHEKQK